MGEDLEAVGAGDADQGHAGLFGDAHGERGGRRHRDHHRRAEHRRLLHHFDRDAARQQQQTFRHRDAVTRQRTGELVERVVPADILAQRDQPALRMPEGRGMHGVGLLVELLRGGKCRHRGVDRGSVEAARPR